MTRGILFLGLCVCVCVLQAMSKKGQLIEMYIRGGQQQAVCVHPQWDGIILIGLCWFLVLCNDGIMLLRDEQRGFYTLPLSKDDWASWLDIESDRESHIQKSKAQRVVTELKAGTATLF